MRVGTQLAAVIVPLVIMAFSAQMIAGFYASRQSLRAEIEYRLEATTYEKALNIKDHLKDLVDYTTYLSSHSKVLDTVRWANRSRQEQAGQERQAEIVRIDHEWITLKGKVAEATAIRNNDLSVLLEGEVAKRDHVGEIFVTDQQGLTVAMTKTLSDYIQADEQWWSDAFQSSKPFIDSRGMDVSTGVLTLGVGVPIYDAGNIIGILKVNFKVSEIADIIALSLRETESQFFLAESGGRILGRSSHRNEPGLSEVEKAILAEAPQYGGIVNDSHDGKESIMAYQPIATEIHRRILPPGAIKGVSGEKWLPARWFLFTDVEKDIAFAPLNELARRELMVSVPFLIVIVIAGIFLSRSWLRPISQLIKGVEAIRAGDYTYRNALDRKDEFGELGAVFDKMAEDLQQNEEDLAANIRELDFQKFALDEHAIVSIADVEGNITYVNDKACEISGYSRWELLGQNHRILKSSEHSTDFYTNLWKTISNGKVWHGEIKNIKKGGGYYWEESTIVPFNDDHGRPFQYIGIRTDITERKQSERELILAKDNAEAANRAKSLFLATMSHEIRTPMNGIVGMSDLLESTELTDEQRQLLNVLKRSGITLMTVINDILDYSKVEVGKLELEQTSFDLVDLLKKTIAPYQILSNKVQMTMTLDPEIPAYVFGDHTRLHQIITNLLNNAFKFTHDGSVRLQVSVKTRTTDRVTIHFTITDTGVGMSTKEQQKLFQPFTQADQSTTRKYGGTGLGLSICKKLLDLMGGEIGVNSKQGEGACFYFNIEFAISSKAPARAVEPERETDYSQLRVLLAEDNSFNQIIARKFMEKLGVDATIAQDGKEVVELVCEQHNVFDVIFMDCEMPNMDGYQATQAIRSWEQYNQRSATPIYALTAHAMKEHVDKCLAAGMDDHLSKPLSLEQLRRAFAKVTATALMGTAINLAHKDD